MVASMIVEGNYFLMLPFGWFATPEQHLRVRGQYKRKICQGHTPPACVHGVTSVAKHRSVLITSHFLVQVHGMI